MASILLIFLVVASRSFANCPVTVTGHEISATQQFWMSSDGRLCNVIFDMSYSYEVVDTLCLSDPYDNCYNGAECGPRLADVLLMKRTDDSTGTWEVIPNIAVSEFPDDDSPCYIGTSTWIRDPAEPGDGCYDDNNQPLCDDPPIRLHSHSRQGSVGMALGCGTWQIRYLLSEDCWDTMYDNSDPGHWLWQSRSMLVGSPCHRSGGVVFPLPIDIEAQANLLSVSDAFLTITMEECEEHPPTDISLRFVKYINSNLDEDSCWLPTPNDSVGLVFEYAANQVDSITLRHNISRISMWSGECMNSPWAAPAPLHSGFEGDVQGDDSLRMLGWKFPSFDCWVGEPFKYKIYVKDVLGRLTLSGQDARPETPRENTTNVSHTLIRADKTDFGKTGGDTLWIVAKDYGLYCEVTTQAFGRNGKKSYVSNRVTAFGDTTTTITVPRDDDGREAYNNGFSQGDYIADCWEASACSCAVELFHPFQSTDSFSVDADNVPKGRDRDGDNFANWEEYRGFLVYADSSVMHSEHELRRTDPTRKTFIAKIDTSIDEFLTPALPTYWNSWSEPEFLLTDSGFRDKLMGERRTRRTLYKPIDINVHGSYRPYPRSAFPNDVALDTLDYQNIIVITAFDSTLDDGEYAPTKNGTVGRTLASCRGDEDGEIVTKCLRFIWFHVPRIDNYFQNEYYEHHSDLIADDSRRLLNLIVAHEIGHAVDMDHVPSGIMFENVSVEGSGRINVQDSTFSSLSKEEISIKLEGMQP